MLAYYKSLTNYSIKILSQTFLGDLIAKKAGDNIDGYPLLVGIYTTLRQTKSDNIEIFIDFICTYARVATLQR